MNASTLILSHTPHQEALHCQEELKTQLQGTHPLIDTLIEEELKIEHAQEIKARCILSYAGPKIFIIAAHHFNIFAQNALLKILEEPPTNTRFIVIAKHKHALLPTMLSRLICQDKRTKIAKEPFKLNLATCTLQDIYTYLKELEGQSLSMEQGAQLIQSLLYALQEAKIPLKASMLDNFDQAMQANLLHMRPSHNLLPLLLMVLQARDNPCF
ncbi:DNA polymerase III subunit delta [Helicobacter bizzozeronii CIII-1]|uniref:DNA polymerase III subunit delta n=1 Tax=Helicobacter bizzozeronii (strain CIII-1) TaxID=1002804 RepID=F8KU29_HELBC|nr:DNA polymerase III subunit delta' [Helicobacter bizzozeronii]CCB80368.1 DNA polymerase III subunit delta [Helicobacter bizzozeronii CIII-1]